MRIPTFIALFALWAGGANAQLDHILAPLPAGTALAKLEQIPAAQGIADAQVAPQTSPVQPAVESHYDLTADQLLNEIQKQLVSYFGLKGDLKLSMVQNWRPVRLPSKDFDLTLVDYPSEGVTSSFTLRFKIACGGAQVGEWQIGLRAQLWQSVWVTQGRLDRGQALDRSLLKSQKVDILHEKQTFLPDDADPDGYDVAQGIGAGQAIAKQDVIERPLVHKGDVVEVVAIHGLLDIHMKALALEDGGANALIKMRNLDSNRDFNAQIINENQVKIHF
jgi:flagella basal body P-ring formation protein FlgA